MNGAPEPHREGAERQRQDRKREADKRLEDDRQKVKEVHRTGLNKPSVCSRRVLE